MSDAKESFTGPTLEDRLQQLISSVSKGIVDSQVLLTDTLKKFQKNFEVRTPYTHYVTKASELTTEFIGSLPEGSHVLVKVLVKVSAPLEIKNNNITIEFSGGAGLHAANNFNDPDAPARQAALTLRIYF